MDAHPPLPAEIWEHTPPAAQELIVAQAAALAQLRAEVAQLKATVEELAQRLGRNSRHSSQPPSADPPQTATRLHGEPSGRQPGGQRGHEGQSLALVPVEAVDVVLPVKPVQNLSQEKLDGGDEREHAVALCRITHRAERGEEGFRLQ